MGLLPSQQRPLTEDLTSPTLVSFLDMARWVAAALVFVAHLRNPLFVGYTSIPPEQRALGIKAWYFVTGWHAEAVVVFFVLSGLLVGAAGLARVHQKRFQPGSYTVDRLTRLYVAFLPALFLGYFLDRIGASLFPLTGFWNHSHPMLAQKVNSAPFETLLSAGVLLGNIVMLQDYYVPPVGSNQPLWTISAEFWFYAVFLFVVLGVALARSAVARVGWFVAVAVVFLVLGTKFLSLLILWCIGAAIVFAPPRRTLPPSAAALIFLLVLVIARTQQSFFDADATARYLKNVSVAVAFAHLVVSLRGRSYLTMVRLAPLNAFLASFSYSLYLLHFPLMLFVLALLHATGWFPGISRGYLPAEPQGLVAYALTIIVVFWVTWLFSLGTEQRTHVVRRFLKSRLASRIPRYSSPK